MPWRNNWGRKVYNTQLQAHMGQFGVSVHGPSTDFARVHGSEVTGVINTLDYTIVGDASKHKVHRNNIERIEFTGDSPTAPGAVFVTASTYDNAFISHMIPRTDKQYAWITGSII
jgi:hypothetical protein